MQQSIILFDFPRVWAPEAAAAGKPLETLLALLGSTVQVNFQQYLQILGGKAGKTLGLVI